LFKKTRVSSLKAEFRPGQFPRSRLGERSLLELNFEEDKIRQSLFETGMAMLDMCSAELRLPMPPLDQDNLAVLEQTLKDYGLLT